MTHAATGEPDIARIGSLLGDESRCRILLAVMDGRALPASRLAAEAGVSAATASSHLAKLTDAGLLTVEVHGRHRYFRLAGAEVGELLEVLQRFAPATPTRSLRQGTRAQALRDARTCYDHLAGRLGVDLMTAMIDNDWLSGGDGSYSERDHRAGWGHDVDYALTAPGRRWLTAFGVADAERRSIRYCTDWSEQRHHLAGPLGRALLDRVVALDWIRRTEASRAVRVTDAGRAGLLHEFGIGARPSVRVAG